MSGFPTLTINILKHNNFNSVPTGYKLITPKVNIQRESLDEIYFFAEEFYHNQFKTKEEINHFIEKQEEADMALLERTYQTSIEYYLREIDNFRIDKKETPQEVEDRAIKTLVLLKDKIDNYKKRKKKRYLDMIHSCLMFELGRAERGQVLQFTNESFKDAYERQIENISHWQEILKKNKYWEEGYVMN